MKRCVVTLLLGTSLVLLVAAAPDVPVVCCPTPTTKKTTRYVYGEKVTERCFPPTLCDKLKHCLGLDGGGGCGCGGVPRQVHTILKTKVVEEKPAVKFEPVPVGNCGCRHRPSPGLHDASVLTPGSGKDVDNTATDGTNAE